MLERATKSRPNHHRRWTIATTIIGLLVTVELIGVVSADLVLVNVRKQSSSSSNSNAPVYDELKVCAMRRDSSSPGKDGHAYALVNLNRTDVCRELDPTTAVAIERKAAFVRIVGAPQCSLVQIALNMEPSDPAMIIIGSNGPLTFLVGAQAPNVYLEADESKFDASLLVIWLIAVVTVVLGSFWTLHEFRLMMDSSRQQQQHQHQQQEQQQRAAVELINEQQQQTLSNDVMNKQASSSDNLVAHNGSISARETSATTTTANKDQQHKNPITIHIGYISVLVLLVIVVVMILLLYFFYSVMTTAFYRIGCLFLSTKTFCLIHVPLPGSSAKKYDVDLRKLFIGLVSIVICIIWFVYRHQSWSWIIQDMMAFSLAVNALSYYRISTYKTVALILALFFLYDIFMVFITPAFTKGTSIMEAVAFGGRDVSTSTANDWNTVQFGTRVDTTNKLPVVIIIPHLGAFKRLCAYYYDYSVSLLGLGDILIPGLSINYAIIYDYARCGRASIYFVVNVIGYFIGLFMAFVALILMNTAQPALFYLCPVLIICSLATALLRKEFRSFWFGEPIHKVIDEVHKLIEQSTNPNPNGAGGDNQTTTINILSHDNQSNSSSDEQQQQQQQQQQQSHSTNRHTLHKQDSRKAILSEVDSA